MSGIDICLMILLMSVLERALDERDRHLLDDIINERLGLGALASNDEVAARNEFGEEIDVHRGGTGSVIGLEVAAALFSELKNQRTDVRDGLGNCLSDRGAGVERPALVPRVRRAAGRVTVVGGDVAGVAVADGVLELA